ncbi:hypothetical protein GLOIN_2v1784770 [Rhizophagus irregularis DAOM 181602=DAOM 197198]|uniref:Uncharacterized protein n=1 Tax=Rhizophagus irregularis (strain DAOM 181602 / DAOM 197198 / MUCL 43194) TaxID=747089 RepID=A0A2P4PBW5_RHIID|nr:hypothetical protein GLOIN_2v1784770 [Rhizophagus irregularis DAOM 181602=DAOM 197198]PKY24972.1 hypothetical protein RhiirB3_439731 [Rhizophagus irregularis]POG62871.1 hypothetical protein GLOIN_2v1784770 [Rhizophagus irregularis DAOM 181602=DAOM 197198]GET50172.1 hypothetical protein GLOIN_2v1784770 [Rhizophagus irregularis DAOM 181602=DAOM 197198]|eukprot:XP_025169737.1 hypothetical protein GLOIN_2v1784770 [Rhizophagus irregularis DAOM 181602=DAOM 197198]
MVQQSLKMHKRTLLTIHRILDDDEYYDIKIKADIFMAESLIKIDPLDIIELLIAANELRIPISIKNFSEK